MKYAYPVHYDWSAQEIIDVTKFFKGIEQAYEKGIERQELMKLYRRFKEIVPSKVEEKKLCDEFEQVSGYSSYRTIQKAKASSPGDIIKMER
ncbi:uncharacterized protein YktA (UPF0223 family) [Thermolongibacillus altinsuensis]|uniref:UPF0223 protein EDD69_10520 n=1 Tax=Thermolongibacillus altinsuensis TaxID=575256 RepID=A0A4R1QEA4_9BACL|nr:UPF0223 family protein [Thermolongibacillus altinsuensis]TCL50224.1 uncharacterized protein YktA (UPF0223 family) [Thermolongibacillus altinsuensis]GMB08608.1 UPF0223 protein [Thermolongibacillus altinsuensis]